MESLDEFKALFNFNIFDLLDEVFKNQQVKNTMIEFNQDQLQAGLDALNQKINTIGGTPYRPYTVKIKKSKGQPTDRVTLYDTGGFYKTFAVRVVTEGYEIIANFDIPDGSILDNFSGKFDFLGLDKEGQEELVKELVFPLLYNVLRKKLGL